jgi:hypothetical protein
VSPKQSFPQFLSDDEKPAPPQRTAQRFSSEDDSPPANAPPVRPSPPSDNTDWGQKPDRRRGLQRRPGTMTGSAAFQQYPEIVDDPGLRASSKTARTGLPARSTARPRASSPRGSVRFAAGRGSDRLIYTPPAWGPLPIPTFTPKSGDIIRRLNEQFSFREILQELKGKREQR